MAQTEMEFALDQARNAAAIYTVASMRDLVTNLRIARDHAKLFYDSELERANEVFCASMLAAIDAYDRSIAELASQRNGDDDDDDG
jgi:hypothetical protein